MTLSPGSPAQPRDGSFIKNNTFKMINTDIQIENRMSYLMLKDAGSNEPNPTGFNPSID